MSGGIYTTRDRTLNLNELTDVTLNSTPTEGQALIYSNGVWTNGEGAATKAPDVFTISGNSVARNNGTYKRISYGCQGQYLMDNTWVVSDRWIQSGTQTNGGSDPDPGAMGIYEKEDDDGQFTSILFVYEGTVRKGWCSNWGATSFLDRYTVGDILLSEVNTPHSTTFDDDGFTFKGPGTPLISSGTLQYSGGAGGVQVLNDLMDVNTTDFNAPMSNSTEGPDGESVVLTYNATSSEWYPRPLLLRQYKLKDLGDVEVIPARRGILKDVGDGIVSDFQSVALTLSLNEDVSDAAPSSNDFLRWNSTESKWEPVSSTSVGEDVSLGSLSDVNLYGLATGDLLQFDGTRWMPTQLDLNSLTNVNAHPNDLQQGNILAWDAAWAKWIPETNLRPALGQEVTDRTNADSDLQDQITLNANGLSDEVTARSGADSILSDRLNDESRDRSSEDTRIEGLTTNNASSITSLAGLIAELDLNSLTNVNAHPNDLQQGNILVWDASWAKWIPVDGPSGALGQEVTDRTNADSDLQDQITLNANGLSDEVTARSGADSILSDRLNDESRDRSSEDTRIEGLTTTNASSITSLATKVNDNTTAIAALDRSYTPPDPSRFELQLKTGLNADGWVTFRNRLYDYSKLKSFQFTADSPFPWGKTGPTNGIEQSLNQSLFNGCAEIRHAPQYYWMYEVDGQSGTFWLMQGQFDTNKMTYGWAYDIGSGSAFIHDRWRPTDSSSGGPLVNSLHRKNLYTCHTLANTGRSTLAGSSDGVAFQEFPLAFSITLDPYLMTSHDTVPIYQDNTWVNDWGLYATYSPDGTYLYISRDGVIWDRVSTGYTPLNVTSISVYPFGRGLGFAMQTSDNRFLLGVQPTPYHSEAYYTNGVGESFCSSGLLVMWWNGTNIGFSRDGFTAQTDLSITDRIGGPWVRTKPDPRCDNPTKGTFWYSTPTGLRYAYDVTNGVNDPITWSGITPMGPFDSRQLILSVPGQGASTAIGGTPSSLRMTRSVMGYGSADIETANQAVINYIPDVSIMGEIGTTIETRTYAPVWACRNYFNVPSMVSFDRGVTWRGFSCGLQIPYAFAHSDEMFVCVGYPSNNKGVIFYSTDAVNWYEAVNDETIPVPGPGLPGITEEASSNHRFSDVYYETEHRRFVAFSQNRVGISSDGINWSFIPIPDDPANPGNRPIFQAKFNGWNEYLRYGDAYYTRGGLADGKYQRILALRINGAAEITLTDTGLNSPRELSRGHTIAGSPANGQSPWPQWWATALGIIASEWSVDGYKIYTYSFPRDSTTLTKSTTTANLPTTQRFFNMTTGFGGLIATGYKILGDSQTEKYLYFSPDGLIWGTEAPLGDDAEFLGVEYVGGEQYVLSVNVTSSANTEFRIAKGWISHSLAIDASPGTITSYETATDVNFIGSRVLVSEESTFTSKTFQGSLFFTTEYRSCGVKPLAIVPRVGYANIHGGGQNNNGGSETGSTPGLFISQPGSSYSLSQRYGLGHGSTSNVPEGSLVEYELTPNVPVPR